MKLIIEKTQKCCLCLETKPLTDFDHDEEIVCTACKKKVYD